MTAIDWKGEANLRERVLFGLVAFAICFVSFRTFYVPQSVKIGELSDRLAMIRLERDALLKFQQATPTLSGTKSFAPKRGVKIKILLGEIQEKEEDVAGLLGGITEPVFLNRLKILKMSFQPPVSEKGYSKSDFSLVVSGSFADVIQYLERLETYPALFDLESIHLMATLSQSQELEAELAGRFFKMDEPGKS